MKCLSSDEASHSSLHRINAVSKQLHLCGKMFFRISTEAMKLLLPYLSHCNAVSDFSTLCEIVCSECNTNAEFNAKVFFYFSLLFVAFKSEFWCGAA